MFFSIRATSPDLLNNRDPMSPQLQKALKIVNLAQLRMSGNRFLWVWQLNDPGLENFDYLQDARLFFLTTDAWLLNEEALEEEDIVIMDVKDISLKILTKFNLSIARTLSKYQQDAIPIRLKQVHVVNAPSFIDKVYGLVKPFLKQGMTDMIHFHAPKSETLYNYLSKEDLPEDFGGTNGTMNDHMEEVLKVISARREQLLNDNLWRAEKKSKNKAPKETTFRSLDID
ncbi:alpha-tocopherol transfer protein-like isoform X2 [Ostrinia furnacalis]|uniref:alpha-tocopherol transfer protein-like isoform X2 n=1 Tax=Ostrinia furnacalis TaxID=93504 RepID=UPI0010402F7D|nr:alpha-tocopherol transfer protein-like isoform X2 [Ostrinia furnacalis]